MAAHLTMEQRQLARRLSAKGLSLWEIGAQVGCSHQVVRTVVRRESKYPVPSDAWRASSPAARGCGIDSASGGRGTPRNPGASGASGGQGSRPSGPGQRHGVRTTQVVTASPTTRRKTVPPAARASGPGTRIRAASGLPATHQRPPDRASTASREARKPEAGSRCRSVRLAGEPVGSRRWGPPPSGRQRDANGPYQVPR
jgi:hypothetical protein